MSFYRPFLVTIAALGLATAVFAKETNHTVNPAIKNTNQILPSVPAQEKVNVNKATSQELVKVKGLNPSKAKAIVTYRKKQGDFKSLAELKQVKGFKRLTEQAMKDITDQLTIN
ncbi:MAG: hypothetical protein ACD_45C00085G0007 [uncultured bacterium]|nr:MAG: hypothetical protein ACD_45C00085G0007 [uncultured bacterium]